MVCVQAKAHIEYMAVVALQDVLNATIVHGGVQVVESHLPTAFEFISSWGASPRDDPISLPGAKSWKGPAAATLGFIMQKMCVFPPVVLASWLFHSSSKLSPDAWVTTWAAGTLGRPWYEAPARLWAEHGCQIARRF